jgi:hypothetical protein
MILKQNFHRRPFVNISRCGIFQCARIAGKVAVRAQMLTEGAEKIKIKLSLCLTREALGHEDVRWSGCTDPRSLYLGTNWRWVVSFTPQSLYSRGRTIRTGLIEGWVGSRAGLDDMEKWQFLTLRFRCFRLTQLYFNYFIQIIRYMFRSFDHLQVEIYTSEINMIGTTLHRLHQFLWKLAL